MVDALSGCARWSLDLLSWLSSCLFSLMAEPKFMKLLVPSRFGEMTRYLQERNDVSLHLLLCSSTRGFLSAVCRRLLHLDALSSRALEFYERRVAMQMAFVFYVPKCFRIKLKRILDLNEIHNAAQRLSYEGCEVRRQQHIAHHSPDLRPQVKHCVRLIPRTIIFIDYTV